MKKILILSTLLILTNFVYAQFPNQSGQSNSSTEVYYKGGLGFDSGLHYRYSYADTTSANLGFIKNIPGFAIRIGDDIWVRNNAATKWLKQANAGSAGSVTSVATGYGLSGGTITTTGTLIVDSATLSNYYLRRKDSTVYYPYQSNPLGYLTSATIGATLTADRGIKKNTSTNFRLVDTVSGAGTRFQWLFDKSALRAGHAAGTQWDIGNVGSGSAAFGESTIASSVNSFAMGNFTTASGLFSSAMGLNTTASGLASFAIGGGSSTIASGDGSAAIGVNVKSVGTASVAMGTSTYINSLSGIAVGQYNDTTNYYLHNPSTGASTDAIFALGNGTSMTRSNALQVLRNGSLYLPAYTNNVTEDSVLTVDYTTKKVKFKLGSSASSTSWLLLGNAGTTAGTNFIGTTDNQDLVAKRNSVEGWRLTTGGALLATGNTTTGVTPTSGAGARMMWIPEKRAFRAGQVSGTQWDAANIGQYSFAVGFECLASAQFSFASGQSEASALYATAMCNSTADGQLSFATNGASASGVKSFAANNSFAENETASSFGEQTVASGMASMSMGTNSLANGSNSFAGGNGGQAQADESFAFGNGAQAGGFQSIAFGTNTNASGAQAISLGNATVSSGISSTSNGAQTTASGDYSLASGYQSGAIGNYSIALGNQDSAKGNISVALGNANLASGSTSTAMGLLNIASGDVSIAMGTDNIGSGANSFVAGAENKSKAYNSFVIGLYADTTTPASSTSRNAANPAFVIGDGTANNARSNAVTVLQGGGVGINKVTPTEALDVLGNVRFSGALMPNNLAGTAGQFLTSSGAGAVPTWTTGSGGTSYTANRGVQITAANIIRLVDTANGAGTKFQWLYDFAAFRAGHVDGTQWDIGNIGANSVAMGLNPTATGFSAIALGDSVFAIGDYSAAFGNATKSTGNYSFAAGINSVTGGSYALAIGNKDSAMGNSSSALGAFNKATGEGSAAIGIENIASGLSANAMGDGNISSGNYSNSFGHVSTASGLNSFITGENGLAQGVFSFVAGNTDTATGISSTSIGAFNKATSEGATAIGISNIASDTGSTALGHSSSATANYSTAFGHSVVASGISSLAAGNNAHSVGVSSSAVGDSVYSVGNYSAAHGFSTQANGDYSTTFGFRSHADGTYSFVTGLSGVASGSSSVAIGNGNVASGSSSIAAGREDTASGDNSFAAGYQSKASGLNSTAMGENAIALGQGAVALGVGVTAVGQRSTALGEGTVANESNSIAAGASCFSGGFASVTMGGLLYTTSFGGAVFGILNDTTGSHNPDPETPASTDPIFTIANGDPDMGIPHNAAQVLRNGNFGIGTNTPDSILHVVGGFKLVNGTQGANKILTSDATGGASWQTNNSPILVADADSVAKTTAVTLLSYTTPNDGIAHSYDASGYLNITAISADAIEFRTTFTAEDNSSQTLKFTAQGLGNNFSIVAYDGFSPLRIHAKANTSITIQTVLTTGIGSITYNAGGTILKIK